MKKVCLVVFCLFFTTFLSSAHAASLWDDKASLFFTDAKAHAVGDVLTVVINESSSAIRSGSANNSKTAGANAKAGIGLFKFITDNSVSASDNFQAKGNLTNSNSISATITVRVTEVKPNGNMMIQGTQTIIQNGEEQKIILTGTIRPEDVYGDNTVPSNRIADAVIKIEGNGPISNKQRQGILTQLFNFLF